MRNTQRDIRCAQLRRASDFSKEWPKNVLGGHGTSRTIDHIRRKIQCVTPVVERTGAQSRDLKLEGPLDQQVRGTQRPGV